MNLNIDKKLKFNEELNNLVCDFGKNNQEGVKSALRLCQETFDCVSIANQKQIAEIFDININIIKTLMKLNRTLRESITEHEVVCCSGPRCANNGSLAVLNAVSDELKIDYNNVTPDGKISLMKQNCFKKCGMGPNIMIDEKFYHNMDAKKARELIKEIKSN